MNLSAQIAARILLAHRIDGTQGERLPEQCRPTDIDSALAIQAALTEHWCEEMNDSVGGWKCALPSTDKIVIAPIYTRTIDSVPPISLRPDNDRARIEPELAFFLGVDLPSRTAPYTPAEIDNAIVRTHLALELINSRYAKPKDCSFPEILADCLVNQGLFIGPEVDNTLAKEASEFTITVTCDGDQLTKHKITKHHGRHPNIHPRAPLYWLIEFLRSRGEGVLAGQALITGSFAGVIEVPLDTNINIHYAGLGQMQINFMAKG